MFIWGAFSWSRPVEINKKGLKTQLNVNDFKLNLHGNSRKPVTTITYSKLYGRWNESNDDEESNLITLFYNKNFYSKSRKSISIN